LDVDVLEDAAECSPDELATRASSDPLVRIRDHQDIVDVPGIKVDTDADLSDYSPAHR
jgi:hypothetical protein